MNWVITFALQASASPLPNDSLYAYDVSYASKRRSTKLCATIFLFFFFFSFFPLIDPFWWPPLQQRTNLVVVNVDVDWRRYWFPLEERIGRGWFPRSGARERASSVEPLRASTAGFRWRQRGKRTSCRAEALAPHAAASKGSSARPSVSAPPLFPRTIYIMYGHDVPWPRTPGSDSPDIVSGHVTPPWTNVPSSCCVLTTCCPRIWVISYRR